MTDDEALELSMELLKRLKDSSPAHLGALFAKGGIVWHNHDRIDLDAHVDCNMIAGLREQFDDLDFRYVESAGIPKGFLLRFVMSGKGRTDGRRMEGHNCLVAEMRRDLIWRIDEYVDPNLLGNISPV